MAELEDAPKRFQVLAQLERVCRTHHALAERLKDRPFETRVLEYCDAASNPQRIVLDANFTAGVRKIRNILIIECYNYGFLAEVTRIVKQTDGL
jgi:hypothetical protein